MAKRKSGLDVNGILLLDKRQGISSNQALQEVKRFLNANKAGHTGSLDPLATGLLPLCFGEATKVSALMLDDNKRYEVSIQLGIMTETGDAEGKIISERPIPYFTEQDLINCLNEFIGNISQVPPMFSALKFKGKKLYELAREGISIDRPARQISIYEINLLEMSTETIRLAVFCSKGTYIRSLAEDIGYRLETCGTVSSLRRIGAGQFNINQALSFEQIKAMSPEQLINKLIAVDTPLSEIPSVHLTTEQTACVKQGQTIILDLSGTGLVRLYNQHHFLGLGELSLNGKLSPKKLFHLNS